MYLRRILPRMAAALLLAASAAACDDILGGGGGGHRPASLLALEPGTQPPTPRGGVDTVSARVLDQRGNPVAGAEVRWSVLVGGGTITAASVTDADGVATAEWVLGPGGTGQVARADGEGTNPVVFNRFPPAVIGGAPAQLLKAGGDGQTTWPSYPARDSLRARVLDAQGRPVFNAEVVWTGRVPRSGTRTDSMGYAYNLAIGDTIPGPTSARARATGLPGMEVQFTWVTQPGPASRVVAWDDTLRITSLAERYGPAATRYGPDGRPVVAFGDDEAFGGSWSLLDNTGAVFLEFTGAITRHRWVRGRQLGQDRLRISHSGLSDTLPVLVRPGYRPRLNDVPVAGLKVGESAAVQVRDEYAQPYPGVVWSSSDPSVVAVSDGTYTGVKPGVAIISASAGGVVWQFGVYVFIP
jgi:hypothetical protein